MHARLFFFCVFLLIMEALIIPQLGIQTGTTAFQYSPPSIAPMQDTALKIGSLVTTTPSFPSNQGVTVCLNPFDIFCSLQAFWTAISANIASNPIAQVLATIVDYFVALVYVFFLIAQAFVYFITSALQMIALITTLNPFFGAVTGVLILMLIFSIHPISGS